jgi:hypothetical protein
MLIIFISLCILSIGSYFIWFSRYNIPAHLELAFIFTKYLVPIFLVNEISNFDSDVLDLYKNILMLGAVFYLLGLIMGNFVPLVKVKYFSWQVMSEVDYSARVEKITKYFFYFGVSGFLLSYAVMGYVPMFASDPLNAKFFRGPYQAPYMRVAVLFRAANYVMYSLPPILFILWYQLRKKTYLFYLIIVVFLIATTLTRGNILMGFLIAMGVICAYRKSLFKYYLVSLIFIFSLGSISFYLIGLLFHNDLLISMYDKESIFETIALGAPDVLDHLSFLKAFTNNPIYTYGRTFYGGLIPGHYQWNPSVWSLMVTNPNDDVNDITSGGLRLPLPLWGYVSFSWVGVVGLSFVSGLINGYLIKAIKKMLRESDNLLIITMVILLYVNIYSQFVSFYIFSMYAFPVFIFMAFYMFRFKWK